MQQSKVVPLIVCRLFFTEIWWQIGRYTQYNLFLLWLDSPDFLKSYDAAGTIQDYVAAMLCGQERSRMSVHNAASWGYFNTTSKSWNADM